MQNKSINLSNYSFLVADTNSYVRKIICGMLRQLGVQKISDVHSGVDAFDVIAARDVDMLILGWEPAQISGSGLLRVLRNPILGHKAKIPIIVSAEEIDVRAVQDILKAGSSLVINRPFSANQLKNRASTLLRNWDLVTLDAQLEENSDQMAAPTIADESENTLEI